MAKLIKTIYDLVALATDKGITGYHTDNQIMDAIHEGQMMLWRELVKKFPLDKRVRNDLLPFQKRATCNIDDDDGIGDLPVDFEQEIDAWTISDDDIPRYPIKFVEQGFFRKRVLDPIDPPSATNPFCCIFFSSSGKQFEIRPAVLPGDGFVLAYWRAPVKPVFSTIESGGTYIYNDATSTDVEWGATMHDIIVRNALARLGLNMRDIQVQSAGQMPPKEITI